MNPDKVDLSSTNRSKKQFKLPKLKNPFKKSDGIKRDTEGKFTSGSGGLLSSKKMDLSRLLPLVIVAALVGGFLVFKSFAANALYANQYSVSACKPAASASASTTDSKKLATADSTTGIAPASPDCKSASAEALTYRLYMGVLGREPDAKGYQYWVQKLAGDRAHPSDVSKSFVSDKRSASLSDGEFVNQLYKQFLGKTKPDDKGFAFWTSHLKDKSWSRTKMATHFASQQAAKNHLEAGFTAYLAKAPVVKIVPEAYNKQKSREKSAALAVKNIKSYTKALPTYVKNSALNLSAAKNSAGKSSPTKADLQAIGGNEKTVRGYLTNAQKSAAKAKAEYKRVQALANNGTEAAKYSPDLSDSTLKSNAATAKSYNASAEKNVNDLEQRVKDIAGQYKVAEKKYEDNLIAQQRAAEAAAAAAAAASQSAGGGGSSSSSSTSTGTTQVGGTSAAEKKRQCNAKPDEHSSQSISHGKKRTDVSYSWTGNSCTRRVQTWIDCDASYTVSSGGCAVNGANAGAASRNCIKDGGHIVNGKCVYNKPSEAGAKKVCESRPSYWEHRTHWALFLGGWKQHRNVEFKWRNHNCVKVYGGWHDDV